MKPSLAISTIEELMRQRENVMLVGAPGIGKTDVGNQITSNLKWGGFTMHPVTGDPTDVKGFLMVVSGEAVWIPTSEMKLMVEADRPTIIILDDLGQAAPSVQASYMQLLLARRINEFEVSEHVRFIACTNRKEDRAGVSGILEPVKSRFCTILNIDVDTDDWCQWAITHGMPVELIAFVRFRPGLLHNFEPSASMANSPCPRTWAAVGRMMSYKIPEAAKYECYAGAVGQGAASELMAFVQVYQSLPNLDGIIIDPMNSPVPENQPAVMYALATGLAHKATASNFDSILQYADRFQRREYAVMLVKDAITRTPALQSTKAFVQYAVKNSAQFK